MVSFMQNVTLEMEPKRDHHTHTHKPTTTTTTIHTQSYRADMAAENGTKGFLSIHAFKYRLQV